MGRHANKFAESLSNKYSQKLLNNAKKSRADAIKMLEKEQFKKQLKQLVIWLVIKLLIK